MTRMELPSEHYFDHDADIGIIGKGKTITQAFESAAEALFAIMADLKQIKPIQKIEFEFEEGDRELALVIWLNTLLNKSQTEGLILNKFELINMNNLWQGKAWGQAWCKNFKRGTEVKGATLTMLCVKQIGSLWEARCVVDV